MPRSRVPSADASDPTWTVVARRRNPIAAWAGHLAALPDETAFHRVQHAMAAAVAAEAHWPARAAARIGADGRPDLMPVFEALHRDARHPLWTPAALLVLDEAARNEWAFGQVSATPVLVALALQAGEPETLASALRRLSDTDVLVLANLAPQLLPALLGERAAAAGAFGAPRGWRPEYPIILRHGPWREPGPFALPARWGRDWQALTAGDVALFAACEEDEVPERVYYKLASPGDADYRRLLASLIAHDGLQGHATIRSLVEDEPAPTSARRGDVVLIGAAETEGGPPRVAGAYGLRRELHSHARPCPVYHLALQGASILPWAVHLGLHHAIVADIAIGFAEALDDEFPKVIPPGTALDVRLTPDLGESPDERFLLHVQTSLEAQADLAEMAGGEHPLAGSEVHVGRGAPGRLATRLPRPPAVRLRPGEVEVWDTIRDATFRLELAADLGPLTLRLAPGSGRTVMYLGPDDEVRVTAATFGRHDQETRTALATLRSAEARQVLKRVCAETAGAQGAVVVFWGHAGAIMTEGAWLDGEWDEDEGVWLVGRPGVEGDGVEEWRLAEFWHHFPDELGEAAARRAARASVR